MSDSTIHNKHVLFDSKTNTIEIRVQIRGNSGCCNFSPTLTFEELLKTTFADAVKIPGFTLYIYSITSCGLKCLNEYFEKTFKENGPKIRSLQIGKFIFSYTCCDGGGNSKYTIIQHFNTLQEILEKPNTRHYLKEVAIHFSQSGIEDFLSSLLSSTTLERFVTTRPNFQECTLTRIPNLKSIIITTDREHYDKVPSHIFDRFKKIETPNLIELKLQRAVKTHMSFGGDVTLEEMKRGWGR